MTLYHSAKDGWWLLSSRTGDIVRTERVLRDVSRIESREAVLARATAMQPGVTWVETSDNSYRGEAEEAAAA